MTDITDLQAEKAAALERLRRGILQAKTRLAFLETMPDTSYYRDGPWWMPRSFRKVDTRGKMISQLKKEIRRSERLDRSPKVG